MLESLAVALSAVAVAAAPAAVEIPDERRTADALARLAERRVFFGHQSVGANVLDGLASLSAARGSPVRIVEVRSAGAALSPGTFAHAYVGTNGDPAGKLESFAGVLAGLARPPDIALVKLCFVDIVPGTDVDGLFRTYRARLDELQRRYPTTRFVHLTVPLTIVQSGPKAWVKELLGRAPYGALENEARERFNAQLRATYAGREPLFDIARLESTSADGAPVVGAWSGRTMPALDGDYTDDGGHLNAAGRDRVARALVAYLAALPAASPAPAATPVPAATRR
jgi:hypothetical protein